MGKVVDLSEYRPHISMSCPDGNVHIVPIALLDDIVDGNRSIDDIEDRDQVIRAILADWLMYVDP